MTAEVLVMNKNGVAMAADSAVTVGQNQSPKVYQSANKIFALSKFHPVGVMVYGPAHFMKVPWETVIKTYRQRLGDSSKATVAEYAEDFRDYLQSSPGLVQAWQERGFCLTRARALLTHCREKTAAQIGEESLTPYKKKRVAAEVIKNLEAHLDEQADETEDTGVVSLERLDQFYEDFEKLIDDVFVERDIPLFKYSRETLLKMIHRLFTECRLPFEMPGVVITGSGVVITGFGREEVFPSYEAFQVDGVFDNILRWRKDSQEAIGEQHPTCLASFAQKDMVQSFMQGMHPEVWKVLQQELSELFSKVPDVIVDSVELKGTSRRLSIDKLNKAFQKVQKHFTGVLRTFMQRASVDPVLETLQTQPKEELPKIAEMLVTLTGFKRQITSTQLETVGGPVDVALISKGDGLVWIERKHYFSAELNPQFFATYNER